MGLSSKGTWAPSALALFLLMTTDFTAPLAATTPTQANVVVATIPVGFGPKGVLFDPANGFVYVANYGSDTVSVIDGATDRLIANISVGSNPTSLAYDSSDGDIYVANSGSVNASVIDGTTDEVVANVTVGPLAQWVSFDPSNGDVYVTYSPQPSCPSSGCPQPRVTVVDASNDTVLASVAAGSMPWGVAADTANGYVYVADSGSDKVSVLGGAQNDIVTTLTVGLHPLGVAFDPSNGDVYVTNVNGYSMYNGSGTVSVISGASDEVIATVAVGSQPSGVAFDSADEDVYVANFVSNTTSVIDGSTNTLIAAVPVGVDPFGVAFDSSNGYVYVANEYSGTVSVIGSRPSNGGAPPLLYAVAAAGVALAILSFVIFRRGRKAVQSDAPQQTTASGEPSAGGVETEKEDEQDRP